MAKKGKRGGYKTRTRTIVKYRTRAMKVARRHSKSVGGLAKERAPVAIAGAILGWADAKRAAAAAELKAGKQAESTGAALTKIPSFGGVSWLGTVGAGLHFYHKNNRGSKWADRFATAALTLAGFKMGYQQGLGNLTASGQAVSGNGAGGGAQGWVSGNG
jgi:hypothetical protein